MIGFTQEGKVYELDEEIQEEMIRRARNGMRRMMIDEGIARMKGEMTDKGEETNHVPI